MHRRPGCFTHFLTGPYHTALAVALALAPLTVEAASEHAFITQFLAHWGGAGAVATRGATRRRSLRG